MTRTDADGSELAVLAVAGVAVCCALPVLLSLGAAVTIVGIELRTWGLVVAGLVAVATAVALRRRQRACRVRQLLSGGSARRG